ncbi:MAG: hypothetical protein IKC35_01075 [Clostridia bacterium]|nr:hypothetical protein [Clostridia bacterium]
MDEIQKKEEINEQSELQNSQKEESTKDEERVVLKKREDFRTETNDPELLVEPYKDGEGPEMIKCPSCGELMPVTIDTCVCCGHYLKEGQKQGYKPMEEKTQKVIRWIVGVVCIIGFIIWYVAKNS